MTGDRFHVEETAQGLERGDYNAERDETFIAIPLRVTGQTADEAVARARSTAEQVSRLIDRIDDVRWPTTHIEAAYALLANLVTALSGLSEHDREIVLFLSPGIDELRRLLDPEPMPAPHPGQRTLLDPRD